MSSKSILKYIITVFLKFKVDFRKITLFLLLGLPTFILAIMLNYILVSYLNWLKPIAYAIVIVIQVSINFILSKRYVFSNEAKTTFLAQYIQYMLGVVVFRFIDWLVYSVFTQLIPIHFIIIQIGNIIIFSLLKYRFAKRVIEGR